MNKMTSILALLISISVHAHAEEIKCKCDEVPFKPDPPCVKACVVAVMKNADMSTLAEKIKLTEYQEFHSKDTGARHQLLMDRIKTR